MAATRTGLRHALVLLAVVTACRKGAAPAESSAPASQAVASEPGAAGQDESITNTQEAGVDEGGIIKTHGEHLVVLRRGRLFSVDLGDDQLRPRSVVDVPPFRGHDAWYDEMLIHGDTIVVVGYSYHDTATEIGLFHIDDAGDLSHVDTYFLRSNDYYSSRNYASRMVGDKLVFYMPHHLGSRGLGARRRAASLPSLRGARRGDDWHRIIGDDDIVPSIDDAADTLHTLVTCDLGGADVGCRGRGVQGGQGRSFYVSGKAIYVWTAGTPSANGMPRSSLYRLPLGEGPIGALHVQGMPIDQFSFKEANDGELHVALTTEGAGEGMWSAEATQGGPAHGDLGMVSIGALGFAKWGDTVPSRAYRDLPEPQGSGTLQNRFVDDALLYGYGSGWGWAQGSAAAVSVHHVDGAWEDTTIPIVHGVDRLEALGRDAVVVGSSGDALHFTSLSLRGRPAAAGHFALDGASQGELRSHGFFYKATSDRGGMLGLPVRGAGGRGSDHLLDGSAAVMYLGVDDLQFSTLGLLHADPRSATDDRCVASCIDWYGNARPVFYRGRVFALLGYELVEGRIDEGSMHEVRRVDMLDAMGGALQRAR